MGWNDLLSQAVERTIFGELQECFNSTKRGYTVPVFMFEKISPPVDRGPIAPTAKKQRGVIVQMLDRLVEARAKRTKLEQKGVVYRPKSKKPK
jgi:hypothetical protein